jgi:hypothetical protein
MAQVGDRSDYLGVTREAAVSNEDLMGTSNHRCWFTGESSSVPIEPIDRLVGWDEHTQFRKSPLQNVGPCPTQGPIPSRAITDAWAV